MPNKTGGSILPNRGILLEQRPQQHQQRAMVMVSSCARSCCLEATLRKAPYKDSELRRCASRSFLLHGKHLAGTWRLWTNVALGIQVLVRVTVRCSQRPQRLFASDFCLLGPR